MSSELVDIAKAKEIASDFLGKPLERAEFSYVILDEHTIEKPNCFVFFYESSQYLETGRFEDRLVGNAPILIDRVSGLPRFLGTAKPVEFYIERFEAEE